jgi:ribosomal protein S25
MHPENKSLVHAAIMMIPASSSHTYRSNKMYGWLRRKYQAVCKQRVGDKNGSYGRRWYHDPNTHQNGKFRENEIPQGWVAGRVPKMRDRYCKKCEKKVDTASIRLTLEVYCEECRKEERKERGKKAQIHDYELIKKIYQEHKIDKIGYYTLAQKYGINKWSIYDYIGRYKEDLQKEFGV